MPKLSFEPAEAAYPKLLDKYLGKRLVVVCGGRCVWDDLALLGVRPGPDNSGYDILCVNDIVMHYPGTVKHFYSNDKAWSPKWLAARRELHTRRYGAVQHSHSCHGGQNSWPWPGHGSSSLGAVYTGLALGYDPVILCGAPLDDRGHYFDPPWVKTNFKREVGLKGTGEMMYWQDARDKVFQGRVKSMSGRTRSLLGGP